MEMNPTQPDATNDLAAARHQLPCGRSVEEVFDDMEADRVTAHALDCAHCTTARESLDRLAEATRMLVDDPAEPPPGLLDKIMTAVRADLSLGRTVPLPAHTAQVDISTSALAAVLRYVVDGVDGIRAHRCRVEEVPDRPASVRVWMSVSLRFGSGHAVALNEARRRVALALPERIGLNLDVLDFEVVDVWVDHLSPGDLP